MTLYPTRRGSSADNVWYSDGLHPYGITALDGSLVSQQAYDISLSLHVPRSPPNLKQGNFMLSLSLLSPSYKPSSPPISAQTQADPLSTVSASIPPEELLYFSRRPAILTYTSQIVTLSSQVLSLPLYMVGLKKESEVLNIPMGEKASFNKGWRNVPEFAMLELQAGQEVQVYDVRLHFKARFSGMRWLMYNHRVLSFLIFTSAFWGSEVLFCLLAWLGLRTLFAPKTEVKMEGIKGEETDTTGTAIKAEGDEDEEEDEEPDLSDTPRTFPTYGRQPPLRYEPKVKDEDSDELVLDETAIQPLGADVEGDDEDEDFEGELRDVRGAGRRTDSGIGTSFSEAGERSGVQRRSRGGRGSTS